MEENYLRKIMEDSGRSQDEIAIAIHQRLHEILDDTVENWLHTNDQKESNHSQVRRTGREDNYANS